MARPKKKARRKTSRRKTTRRKTAKKRTVRRGGKPSLKQMVREFERRHIEQALRATDGNRTHSARRLGMHRTTLIRKIHELGLD